MVGSAIATAVLFEAYNSFSHQYTSLDAVIRTFTSIAAVHVAAIATLRHLLLGSGGGGDARSMVVQKREHAQDGFAEVQPCFEMGASAGHRNRAKDSRPYSAWVTQTKTPITVSLDSPQSRFGPVLSAG